MSDFPLLSGPIVTPILVDLWRVDVTLGDGTTYVDLSSFALVVVIRETLVSGGSTPQNPPPRGYAPGNLDEVHRLLFDFSLR